MRDDTPRTSFVALEAQHEFDSHKRELLKTFQKIVEHSEQLERELAALKADAISISDIESEIAHIKKNGSTLRVEFGAEHEGRCRELSAGYLQDFIVARSMKLKLAAIDAAKTTTSEK